MISTIVVEKTAIAQEIEIVTGLMTLRNLITATLIQTGIGVHLMKTMLVNDADVNTM